jgi:two-component system response regulator MprA
MSMPTILIVDDDADMAQIVKIVLEFAGYSCRLASNGQQALGDVAANMPDLVLMDVMMPIMNGAECARELRESYGPDLPIVIMTAAEHAGSRGQASNADAVLAKPFEIDELLSVVTDLAPLATPQPKAST